MSTRIALAKWIRMAWLAALLAILPEAWASAGQVRGTIVDREGKPASGAKVRVVRLAFMESSEIREATADGSGAFSVEAGPGDWAVYALRGEEGGRANWQSLAKITEGGPDPKPVVVRLGPPTRLKGLFRDAETGEPIAGGLFVTNDARRVVVDAQGRFEVPGLELTNHEAYPLCPGYERRRILFDTTARPDAELELKLTRGGRVFGRVLDESGKPIPGSTVGLRTSGSILSGSALWEQCSVDGRFVYDGRPLGKTGRLTARAPNYQDQEREDIIVLDPSSPAEFNFTLRPSPQLKGLAAKLASQAMSRRNVSGLVVGPDRKPVAGAVVRWGMRMSSDSIPETKTDADGSYLLRGVPDSSNVLSVMAKGLAPAFPPVQAGGDIDVDVDLKAGVTIRGRVVDEFGTPIEGVMVVPSVASPLSSGRGYVYLDESVGTTDREGKYALEGMPEDVKADILTEHRSSVRQKLLSPSDESKNEVVLLGEGEIRGRVVGPLGRPVRNFRIQVGIPKDSKPGDPVGGYFAGYGGTGLAFTRNDGEFTISGLTAGHLHRLTVIADEMGSAEVNRVPGQSSSRPKPASDLTIEIGAGHPLRVRVVQKQGKWVDNARVTVIQSEAQGVGFQWGYSDGGSWEDSVTRRVNDQGWAEFPSLAFGKGVVVVRAKGFSRARFAWANNEAEIDAFLEPEAKVQGAVLDEAGKPMARAKVMLSWGQGESLTVAVDEKDGRYQAEGLASGSYTLTVSSELGRPLSTRSVILEPGKATTEDFRVTKPAPGGVR